MVSFIFPRYFHIVSDLCLLQSENLHCCASTLRVVVLIELHKMTKQFAQEVALSSSGSSAPRAQGTSKEGLTKHLFWFPFNEAYSVGSVRSPSASDCRSLLCSPEGIVMLPLMLPLFNLHLSASCACHKFLFSPAP